MGGYYSGRWHWYTKKTTVEECSIIAVRDYSTPFLAQCYADSALVYKSETEGAKRAYVFANDVMDQLLGRAGEERAYQSAKTGQQFKLSRTPCNYGGCRYWLLCPTCGRRCGKLYKPYYGRRYACRGCHDLTYTSAQEAHEFDRSASIGDLVRKLDILTRAELVDRKLERCRPGSKNFERLQRRWFQIMGEVMLDV